LGHGAQPVTATYTSWRRYGLLDVTERDGTFVSTFIEKLQQASSNDRIFHTLSNMRRIRVPTTQVDRAPICVECYKIRLTRLL